MTERWAIGKIIEIGGKRYFEWRKHDKSGPKECNEALERETSDIPYGVDAPVEIQSREQNRRNAEGKAAKVRHSR
jgi:hypothetical protein